MLSQERSWAFSYYDMIGISGQTKDETVMLPSLTVDKNFFAILGLKWKYAPLSGSQLDAGQKMVINELAVEKLHLPANPVGSFIKFSPQNIEVAGVVKNFNFGSLGDEIQPLGLFIVPDTAKSWARGTGGCYLFAKTKPHTNLPTLLGSMQNIFKKFDADTPFDYTFMDDAFNARYKAEDKLAAIFSIFTVITIVLAAMGLFGLAAFTTEQRTKEIGTKGFRREHFIYQRPFVQRLFKAGSAFYCHILTNSLVGHAQLAAGLCIPHSYSMVDVWVSRTVSSHCGGCNR